VSVRPGTAGSTQVTGSLESSVTIAYGYDLAEANGTVVPFGGARSYGSATNLPPGGSIVDMLPTPNGAGYLLVGADGVVRAFGDATFHGSLSASASRPIVGASSTPDGGGYWLVSAAGQVTAYGDARGYGSITAHLAKPVVAMASTPDGKGYWIIGADGGVFAFGDAKFHGSLGAHPPTSPVVGILLEGGGSGYLLAEADGTVVPLGSATTLTIPKLAATSSPVVSVAGPETGAGYWLAERSGSVLAELAVAPEGSLARAPTSPVTSIAAVPLHPVALGYDLAESNGAVVSFGGAPSYGSAAGLRLAAPIVDLAPTPAGKGYWLAAADGGLFSFGDARYHGSMGGKRLSAPVVGMAATPDGNGYWLVAADGGIFSFGDAHFYGSMGGKRLSAPVVGIAPTLDGKGYWLVASDGGVFTFGDARYHGSLGAHPPASPVVGISLVGNDTGYLLAEADGAVVPLGSAAGIAVPKISDPSSPVVEIAGSQLTTAFWLAERNGSVIAELGAPSRGSLAGHTSSPVVAIAAVPALPTRSPLRFPAGAIGYDLSWPQCTTSSSTTTVPLPGPPSYAAGSKSYTVTVIGVDGWADGNNWNPCLVAEVAWAKHATGTGGAPFDLYTFLNAPSSSSTIDLSGPAGTCSTLVASARPACLAYNFGFNSVTIAHRHAALAGVYSPMWWLDIENPGYWECAFTSSGSLQGCSTALNSDIIQGAVNALRLLHVTVGLYSTSLQYGQITGNYVPKGAGVPIWIAGAYWTSPPYPASYGFPPPSQNAKYCGGTYNFAHGIAWMLQETPGSGGYPFDPDVAC